MLNDEQSNWIWMEMRILLYYASTKVSYITLQLTGFFCSFMEEKNNKKKHGGSIGAAVVVLVYITRKYPKSRRLHVIPYPRTILAATTTYVYLRLNFAFALHVHHYGQDCLQKSWLDSHWKLHNKIKCNKALCTFLLPSLFQLGRGCRRRRRSHHSLVLCDSYAIATSSSIFPCVTNFLTHSSLSLLQEQQ